MKTWLLAIAMLLSGLTLGFAPLDADARRLGGGKPAGMQRQLPPKQADAPPAQTASPSVAAPAAAGAAGGAAAAAGKRSWMGPIAGLAAGLGIAALLSHLGMGEAFANMLTMVLLAVVAFVAIRWAMRRFGGGGTAQGGTGNLQFAGAGAGSGPVDATPLARRGVDAESMAPRASGAGGFAAAPQARPEGFDAAAFERIAKMIFIRLQAANDAGQVDDLRRFTTPELFASLRLDLQERGATAQQTDVLQLDAEVVDTAQEDGQWVVSVRFHGLIRESADAAGEPFDELWHLVQPIDGGRDWAIAGITPNA